MKTLSNFINSLMRIVFLLVTFFAAMEIFWANSKPEFRQEILLKIDQSELAYSQLPTSKKMLTIFLWQLNTRKIELEFTGDQKFVRTDDTSQREPSDSSVPMVENLSEGMQSFQHASQEFWHQKLCSKPATGELKEERSHSIYKWTDTDGTVHFSDKNTASQPKQVADISKGYSVAIKTIDLNFMTPDWTGDKYITSEIKKQSKQIYKIVSRFIPKEEQRQINLNIVLFKDVESFERFRNDKSQNGSFAAYYNPKTNSIYAPNYPDAANTLNILRHEVTHAILAGMVGYIPVWLNEGLAQYMERLEWKMNVAISQPAEQSFSQLGANSFNRIVEMSHREFYQGDFDYNYASADGVVYYLLGQSTGRQWLKKTLASYAKQPCMKFDPEASFDRHYAGGYRQAQRSWQRWIAKGQYGNHRY